MEIAAKLEMDEATVLRGGGAFLSVLIQYLPDEDYARIHYALPNASAMLYLFHMSLSLNPKHHNDLPVPFRAEKSPKSSTPLLLLLKYLHQAGFSHSQINHFLLAMGHFLIQEVAHDILEIIEIYIPGLNRLISGNNIAQILQSLE